MSDLPAPPDEDKAPLRLVMQRDEVRPILVERRTITVDVASCIRWSLFGLAAVLLAAAQAFG